MSRVIPCRWLAVAALMSIGLLIGGCGSGAKAPPREKIKLGELAPRPIPVSGATDELRRTDPRAATAIPLSQTGRPMQFIVQRLVFDRPSDRLAMGLALLDEPQIDQADLQVWRANGFGLGRIEQRRLPMWNTQLPRPHSTNVHVIGAGPAPSPITLISRVDHAQLARVVDRKGQATMHKLIGGQWQMMINLLPGMVGPQAAPRLELMPHHYGPRTSIMPRPPQEKQMDGESFTELSLSHTLRPGDAWVIWARCVQPHQAGQDEANVTDPAIDESQVGITGTPPAATNAGDPLAQLMLTGRRASRPVQIVLLIAPAP